MRTTTFLFSILFVISTTGCGDDDAPTDSGGDGGDGGDGGLIEIVDVPGCNPIVPAACPYPYPNMMLMAEDPSTPTGFRVNLDETNMGFETGAPSNIDALGAYLNRADGFSIGTPILMHLGTGDVDRATLPSVDDLGASVEATSSIQLIHRGTGERVPIWAETDLRATDDSERSVMVRIQDGLENGQRYVVVVTNAVKASGGADIDPSPAYGALRDGLTTNSEIVEGMRSDYEELFTFLEAQGVARADTLLAWDFVSFSDEFATGLLLPHVERARAALADDTLIPCADCAAPLSYTITSCLSSDMADATATGCTFDDTLHSTELRRIVGTFTVPSFLDPTDGMIRLDPGDGTPLLAETVQAELVVHIPASLATAAAGSAPLIIFGHGFLGDAAGYINNDLDSDGVQAIANELNAIVVGTRWVGLAAGDNPVIVAMLADGALFQSYIEGLVQSMVNTTLLPPFVRGDFKDDPTLAATGGGALLDPSRVYYYGISLGGIFGTVFAAVSPDVETSVLHIPTAAFANVLQHSYLFAEFQDILTFFHQDRFEQQIYIAYIQRAFDPNDPINWVRHLDAAGAVTPLGAKNALFQIAWGDAAAPDFNAYTMARTADLPVADVSPFLPYGLENIATPTAPGTSAMTIFDPGLGRRELRNDDSGDPPYAHGSLRRNAEIRDQVVAFFEDGAEGTVIGPCGGPCNITPEPVEGETVYPTP